MARERIAYTIDADDIIVSVGGAWNAFAVANDAPELQRELVLGRRLWDFVTDATTRQLYGLLVERVRAGQPARFPLRCDSPGARRRLEMRVTAVATDVRFETRTLGIEERDPQRLWDRAAPREEERLRACSWCNRIDVSGAWKEVEEAVRDLGLFEYERLPTITHGMCPACVTTFEARLQTGSQE